MVEAVGQADKFNRLVRIPAAAESNLVLVAASRDRALRGGAKDSPGHLLQAVLLAVQEIDEEL